MLPWSDPTPDPGTRRPTLTSIRPQLPQLRKSPLLAVCVLESPSGVAVVVVLCHPRAYLKMQCDRSFDSPKDNIDAFAARYTPRKVRHRGSPITSPHFSQWDYIEGCKRREYFHLDDLWEISIIVKATDRQLDADCSDSALHEPMPDSQA